MSFNKTELFNLTLSALLLSHEINNAETDDTNEARVLRTHYNIALSSTLQDLDLDGLSSPVKLQLIEVINDDAKSPWTFAYKYPDNCAFLRRLRTCQETDNKYTHISKRVAVYKGQKAILTDEEFAEAEIIPTDVELKFFTPMAFMAVAYKLAILSAPLIVGKGSKTLRDQLEGAYRTYKGEAQETDSLENFNFQNEYVRSEFVMERMS